MIDLYDTEALIVDGIYGDDRMSRKQRDEAMAALAALVAEVERLRAQIADCEQGYRFAASKAEAKERAAVVAWLRAECGSPGHEDRYCAYCRVRRNIAADIERGEHRRKEKP
jgi:hypothetical protein